MSNVDGGLRELLTMLEVRDAPHVVIAGSPTLYRGYWM